MNEDKACEIVRHLKIRVLEGQRRLAPASMLDCAAHMILYLDTQEVVHRIALQFLLERFGATRANLGYGNPTAPFYASSAIETVSDLSVPSTERPIPNHVEAIQRVWRSAEPVSLNTSNASGMERMWAAAKTKAKLARRLEFADRVFGIVCIDDTVTERYWKISDVNYLDQFVLRFLAPILSSYQGMQHTRISELTAAEITVVRLAIRGHSYKEIASALNKSPNTVDNQLRSARAKLGVRNQVELVRACSGWLSSETFDGELP